MKSTLLSIYFRGIVAHLKVVGSYPLSQNASDQVQSKDQAPTKLQNHDQPEELFAPQPKTLSQGTASVDSPGALEP